MYKKLNNTNVNVYAYDYLVKTLPDEFNKIRLVDDLDNLDIDVIIVFGQQSSFKSLNYNKLQAKDCLYIIDANRYLYDQVINLPNVKYINVGSIV